MGITRGPEDFEAVMLSNTSKGGIWDLTEEEGDVEEVVKIDGSSLTVKVACDFTKDQATCFIKCADGFKQIGKPHDLRFRLDHFTGVRFALSCFSTVRTGGTAVFKNFRI